MRDDADDPVTAAIETAILGVIEAAGDLPFERLRPGERHVLGGSLFAGAPRLVTLVGRALEGDGASFPDVPLRGEDLLRGRRRAAAWRRLRDLLGALHALAGDSCLRQEAALCGAALTVVRHVEAEAALPFSAPERGRAEGEDSVDGGGNAGDAPWRLRRGVALLPALRLLDRRQRAKERARRRNAAQASAPEGAGRKDAGAAEAAMAPASDRMTRAAPERSPPGEPRRVRPRSRRQSAGVLLRERLAARLQRDGQQA